MVMNGSQKRTGLGAKKIAGTLWLSLMVMMSGCSVMKDAKQAFDNDINGFKSEFARLYLKEDVK
jgi:uncharacterized lipoprotein YehR (DUF1307 family)